MGGTAIPARCAVAPSSIGAGILLQSTSSRFFWFIAARSYPSRVFNHANQTPSRYPSAGQVFALENALSARPHQAALLPAPIALLLAFALVVQLLALGDRQQQLGAAPLI